jgi:hypothetical protein
MAELIDKIGNWLCRMGWHKINRFAATDLAMSKGLEAVEVCRRCDYTRIVGFRHRKKITKRSDE